MQDAAELYLYKMDFKSPRKAAEVYEQRSESTYKSRIILFEHLLRQQKSLYRVIVIADALALLALISPVVTGIPFSLTAEPEKYGVLAVFVTVIQVSLGQLQSFLSIETRIEQVRQGYLAIQRVSQQFELIKGKPGLKMSEVATLIGEYQNLLSSTENHSTKQFKRGIR